MYIKPEIKSYSTDDLLEALGPCQNQYVELQIYTEQIQARLSVKSENVVMVAKIREPMLYKAKKIV